MERLAPLEGFTPGRSSLRRTTKAFRSATLSPPKNPPARLHFPPRSSVRPKQAAQRWQAWPCGRHRPHNESAPFPELQSIRYIVHKRPEGVSVFRHAAFTNFKRQDRTGEQYRLPGRLRIREDLRRISCCSTKTDNRADRFAGPPVARPARALQSDQACYAAAVFPEICAGRSTRRNIFVSFVTSQLIVALQKYFCLYCTLTSVANEYATRKDGNQKIVMMARVAVLPCDFNPPEFVSVSCALSIATTLPPPLCFYFLS